VLAQGIIREARSRAELGLRELPRGAGTSHATLARYERGAVDPTTGTLERIVAACGYERRVLLDSPDRQDEELGQSFAQLPPPERSRARATGRAAWAGANDMTARDLQLIPQVVRRRTSTSLDTASWLEGARRAGSARGHTRAGRRRTTPSVSPSSCSTCSTRDAAPPPTSSPSCSRSSTAAPSARARAGRHRTPSPPATWRDGCPREFDDALDTIELNLVQMPLGKLQRPLGLSETAGRNYPRFLYDDSAFHEGVTARQVHATPMRVVLEAGVGDWLVSLAGLLRPLLELHWTHEVATFNGTELAEDRLRDFLFGSDRENLARLRPGLLDGQQGRCFYCGAALRAGQVDVDHFVPWSRVPNDGLQNLVLADRRCNNSKRDHWADLPLLTTWAARPQDVLRQVADDAGWPLRQVESRRIARGLYARLPEGTHLWQQPGVFAVLDRSRLVEGLAVLEDA
jgi:transcriptional regulator with XRE-family HTH domain